MQGRQSYCNDKRKQVLGASNQTVSQNHVDGIQSLLQSDTLLSELEIIRQAIAQTSSTVGANFQPRNCAATKYPYLHATGLIANSYPLPWLHPNFTQSSYMTSSVPGVSYSNMLSKLMDSRYYNRNSVFHDFSNHFLLSKALTQSLENRNEMNRILSTFQSSTPGMGPTMDDLNADVFHQEDDYPETLKRETAQD